jgi:hypothetical protein
MKKMFRLKAIQRIAGFIALVAVIGFSFAACDDGSTGGGGGGGGGQLTVLNLPAGDVYAIHVNDYSGTITSYAQWSDVLIVNFDLTRIARVRPPRGKTSPFELFDWPEEKNFNRSGTFLVEINHYELPRRCFSQVKFTNGSATIDWNNASYIF